MKDNMVISYKRMRTVIGILGMLLGFVCIIGGLLIGIPILPSISDYYHTGMRNVFEGILVAVGVFLLSYRGYDRIDNWITSIAGISIIGVAFFPCKITQVPHVIFATIFFLLLGYMSYFRFTLGNNKKKSTLYRICGIIIYIGALIILFFGHVGYTVLVMEIIMLNAFGLSWLVKGT